MIRGGKTDIFCIAAAVIAVLIAAVMTAGCIIWAEPEVKQKHKFFPSSEYAELIFDDSYVHEIDIRLPQVNWDYMTAHATEEQYVLCSVVIDGEEVKNAAIRPKGNSSLSAIKSQGSDRFSFKIEFDHYDENTSYHGLDKLALNNLGQDVSCMKDFLTYHMMNEMGVAAPLSSYALLKLNGEDFGLYLAVEGIEDSFAYRNYGEDFGNLYKPECFAIENVTPKAFINPDAEIYTVDYTGCGPGDRVDILGTVVREPFESCFGDNMEAAAFKYLGDDPAKYNVFFESSVFDMTEADKASFIGAVKRLNSGEDPAFAMDTDSMINYFVVHNFVNNYDGYTGVFVHNYYVYEKDGILSMVPWDYNLAFGIFTFETVVKSILGENSPYEVELEVGDAMDDVTNMVNYPIDTPTITVDTEERPMLSVLLENEKYMDIYHERYSDFLNGYFYSGKFEDSFRNTFDMIYPYVEKGMTFYNAERVKKASEAIHSYCILRAESISGQLDGTIPATTEGQREKYDTLIDASDVDLYTSVTFDSLIFGIREEDIREILDAVAGDNPHNSSGIDASVREVSEDSSKLPAMLGRIFFSSSLLKKAVVTLISGPLLLIVSIVILCIARKKVINYERRKNRRDNNAVSP